MGFPGLSEAMAKIDETAGKLDLLVSKLDRIIQLLEEQNGYIENGNTTTEMFFTQNLSEFKNLGKE